MHRYSVIDARMNLENMFLQTLQKVSVIILVATPLSYQETVTTTPTPVSEQTEKSMGRTKISEIGRDTNNTEDSWRVNESFDPPRSTSRIHSADLATIHKYRRNGHENSPDTTAGDLKRYFHVPVFPHHPPASNEFETNFAYNHNMPGRYRFNDEIRPVRVQNCGQYSRDVNRLQNHAPSQRYPDIVQGWIGGKSRWRDKDDKYHESTIPPYIPITTATAKVPPSFNRYQENTGNNRDRNAFVPVKSKLYNSEHSMQDSRDYSAEGRNRGFNSQRNSHWTLPTYRDRNNRIIYYEYNFDNLRRPKPYYMREYEGNCGFSENEFVPCDPNDIGIHGKPHLRHPYDGSYNREYPRPYFPPQSKSWPGTDADEDDTGFQFPGQFGEDTRRRFKNTDHEGQRRPNTNGYRGYVYSLDLPRDRHNIPESSPSAYTTHFPFERNQFLNDDDNKYSSSSKSSHFLIS